MRNRHIRVAEEIKRILSDVILRKIEDPDLPALTTITKVKVSKDLSYATIYVNSAGKTGEKDKLLEVMERAKGFMRSELASQMRLRKVPVLRFEIDEALEKGMETVKLIDKVMAEQRAGEARRKAAAEKKALESEKERSGR